MTTLIGIVEGDGEVAALRSLIYKLVDWEEQSVQIPQPKNAHGRDNITTPGGLERFLRLARTEPVCDGVLVLIDADEDCACELAVALSERARALGLPFPVAVVCAKSEYEAWFLASLETVAGHAGIPAEARYEGDVEAKQGIKEWLADQMPSDRTYKPTRHQPALTERIDPALVRGRSRSFRRLEHAIQELLAGEVKVTPDEC